MYTYELWDKTSPINGVSAELALKDLVKPWEQVYLIKNGDVVEQMQSESFCPYKGETFEESAKLHCEALNAPPTPPKEVI